MISLYYHGGSANHGCEAIVRSTAKILNVPIRLFTNSPEEDIEYDLKQVVEIVEDKEKRINRKSLEYILCAINHKITRTDYQFIKCAHKDFLKHISGTDIC